MPWLPANGDCTRRQVPHPWSSTFSAAVDSSAPHYGAWYRVSGTERVAVGCAAQTRYPRTRTYLKSHRVAGAENRIGTPGRQLSAPLTWCDLRTRTPFRG